MTHGLWEKKKNPTKYFVSDNSQSRLIAAGVSSFLSQALKQLCEFTDYNFVLCV